MPRPAPPSPAGEAPAATRERIRAVAEELYVLRGHDGFSFGDVAEIIGTTRANIHHHFGNKRRLMEELVARFASDAQARIERHWTREGASFSTRLADQLEDLRRFYVRFNTTPGDRNVWSPVSRLRLDLPVLGEPAAKALERVSLVYDVSLRRALAEAVRAGELSEETPVEELTRILRMTLLSCPPMTQDTGRFAEIEQLFGALDRMISGTWGRAAARA